MLFFIVCCCLPVVLSCYCLLTVVCFVCCLLTVVVVLCCLLTVVVCCCSLVVFTIVCGRLLFVLTIGLFSVFVFIVVGCFCCLLRIFDLVSWHKQLVGHYYSLLKCCDMKSHVYVSQLLK